MISQGDKTRLQILEVGIKIWHKDPARLKVSEIASQLDLSHPAVVYHFSSAQLKDAVAKHAVEIGDSRVIVQLIATNHKAVRDMNEKQKVLHFTNVIRQAS